MIRTLSLIALMAVLVVLASGTSSPSPGPRPTLRGPDPYIGEIVMFGGNFAPRGWALCNGQLLSISSNQALFSILGTTYGGNGVNTFGLPDLRGRVAMHPGHGPGLSNYNLGQSGGVETVTLTAAQMPSHSHNVMCTTERGDNADPTANFPAAGKPGDQEMYSATGAQTMNPTMISSAGSSQAHPNIQPYQTVNYIIALVGIFPS